MYTVHVDYLALGGKVWKFGKGRNRFWHVKKMTYGYHWVWRIKEGNADGASMNLLFASMFRVKKWPLVSSTGNREILKSDLAGCGGGGGIFQNLSICARLIWVTSSVLNYFKFCFIKTVQGVGLVSFAWCFLYITVYQSAFFIFDYPLRMPYIISKAIKIPAMV